MCSCARSPPTWGLPGNHGADALVETGRQQHPNNGNALPKQRRLLQWDELGLEEMFFAGERSGSDVDSGASSSDQTSGRGSSTAIGTEDGDSWLTDSSGSEASEFGTDVSDTRRVRARVMQQR